MGVRYLRRSREAEAGGPRLHQSDAEIGLPSAGTVAHADLDLAHGEKRGSLVLTEQKLGPDALRETWVELNLQARFGLSPS